MSDSDVGARLKLSVCFLSLLGCFVLLLFLYSFRVESPLTAELFLQGPTLSYPFGFDEVGRPLGWALIRGTGISVFVAFMSTAIISLGAVILLFLVRGGSYFEFILFRIFEVIESLPSFLWLFLWLSLTVHERGGAVHLCAMVLGVAFFSLPPFWRKLRGIWQELTHQPYIEGAKALGATPRHILRYHFYPALVIYLKPVVLFTFTRLLLVESFLSFFGWGLPAPNLSLGALLHKGSTYYLASPHLMLWPGFILTAIPLFIRIKLRASRQGGPLKAQETDQ